MLIIKYLEIPYLQTQPYLCHHDFYQINGGIVSNNDIAAPSLNATLLLKQISLLTLVACILCIIAINQLTISYMHSQHRCMDQCQCYCIHFQISNDDLQKIAPTICVIQYQEKGSTIPHGQGHACRFSLLKSKKNSL